MTDVNHRTATPANAAPADGRVAAPVLSVVIPTHDNLPVLRECLEHWQRHAGGLPVELLVIEDGCSDGTAAFLGERSGADQWGRDHLRWFHADDLHELRCTNLGMSHARAPLIMVWQDDMFVQHGWFVRELLETFDAYPELGLLCLTRGLNCSPCDDRINAWADLHDLRRQRSSIGRRWLNWFRLAEVDIVIRPWVVRRACVERVGVLDEAFVPTEWDEADLCFRLREAGWKVATHAYERLGAYRHLGSTTLSRSMSEGYKARVLANGRLFHERWDGVIRRDHDRRRASWSRRASWPALGHTVSRMGRMACDSVARRFTSGTRKP